MCLEARYEQQSLCSAFQSAKTAPFKESTAPTKQTLRCGVGDSEVKLCGWRRGPNASNAAKLAQSVNSARHIHCPAYHPVPYTPSIFKAVTLRPNSPIVGYFMSSFPSGCSNVATWPISSTISFLSRSALPARCMSLPLRSLLTSE